MTNEEIYNDLLKKTKNLKIKNVQKVTKMSDICEILSYVLVTENTLDGVDYDIQKLDFAILFECFEPKKIVGHGTYLKQLQRVLEYFKPENPSPYKNMTQAIYQTARFLSHYNSFDDFAKEVSSNCLDTASTYQYLMNFRKESSLSSLYFVKTCTFFEKTGLLDIPIVSKKAKEYLLTKFDIPDENEILFKKMISLCKENGISCHELNERILSL